MKYIILLIIGVFVLIGVALFAPVGGKPYDGDITAVPTVKPTKLSDEKLWNLIQKWRADNNLPEYIKDERLCTIAKLRAPEQEGELANAPHLNFRNRVREVVGEIRVSENATQGGTEQYALNSWLSSPPHKKALLADWKYSCVATHHSYAVQIFSNF